ncbi:aldehyde dehydrogenase family protein [Sphingobium sp. H39-3-25]|uniref:aldehyde dehydrogenase family protein n=1 Tax=Sphingobium arseniciresistens TaxID=3030834 RepID=UPI0023B9C001|nr:aldehyde dehydrogenase family protein [Sphingobium arseniciresistens]
MNRATNASRMLIGGKLVESLSGDWLESIDPSTEEVIGHAPAGNEADVDQAVEAAEAAWPAWHGIGVAARAEAMRAMGRRMLERADEILEVEVRDTGNTITPMRGDVRSGVEGLNYYAGLAYELKGETIPSTPGGLHMTLREPYGIVARIAPFNHPIMFATARTAAALIAGNAVIVKPPETSPLSALILAEIAAETMPPGVFNIVTGTGAGAGAPIARHPAIKRIAFIGSVPTGMAIQRAAAEVAVKHVTLELGGKNPMIVFPDADIEETVSAAIAGMNFAWQGQSCGSTSRLLLHESIYDRVVEALVERVRSIRVGNPLDPESQMGPINSRGQYEKVLNYVEIAKGDGARLAVGGARPAGDYFKRGFWIEPTLFVDVEQSMRIAQEEVFGPILSVLKWRTVDEAVAISNATEFGLTASIRTNDINQAMDVARRVRSGYIWINGAGPHFPAMPFGGFKNSGVAREEGIEEMLSYTETKAIHILPQIRRQ